MEDLKDYFFETFGVQIKPVGLRDQARKLPLYLLGDFDYYTVRIGSFPIVFAVSKDKYQNTPNQLEKWSRLLSEYLGATVVYIFDNLESWQRKRLIEKKIAFVVPWQHCFIPDFFLQISNGTRKMNTSDPSVEYLSFPAQCLLLYHLEVTRLEEISFQQLGEMLEYSAMTISRAVKELAALQLVQVVGSKEKYLLFKESGRRLWEMALPHLQSPVREFLFSDKIPPNVDYFRYSADSALASYTMLAATQEECMAIGRGMYRTLKNESWFSSLYRHPGPYKLEVWQYDPVVLSNDKDVDKLSLYLSMQNDPDERVQGALQELLNNVAWL